VFVKMNRVFPVKLCVGPIYVDCILQWHNSLINVKCMCYLIWQWHLDLTELTICFLFRLIMVTTFGPTSGSDFNWIVDSKKVRFYYYFFYFFKHKVKSNNYYNKLYKYRKNLNALLLHFIASIRYRYLNSTKSTRCSVKHLHFKL
jgi:hypothetical protein